MMRPTIPLGPWRLAIDLPATRALAARETRPTRDCGCGACRVWAAVHAERLPASLATALRRIGIDPAQPAEAYEVVERDADVGLRLGYFAVGRIVSGPAELVESPETGSGRLYHPLREASDHLALAVAYQHTLAPPPEWLAPAPESLLAIDLYVQVPRTPALDTLRASASHPRAAD
jgi:hypothetical protein